MSEISTWSVTASDNNNAAPDGFPEGMPPSGVNDAAREVMAAIRRWYETAEWIDYGLTPTRIDGTTFTMAGSQLSTFTAGRRFKADGSSVVYGTVTGSSFSSPDTTVTVVCDSGNLPSTLTSVAVGIVSSGSASSLPRTQVEVYKSSDTSRTSTTTLTDDAELIAKVPSAGTYALEAYLAFQAAAGGTQGFKAAIAISTGSASGVNFFSSGAVNGAAFADTAPKTSIGSAVIAASTISTAAAGDAIKVSGTLTFSAACLCSLQWAQNSSSANAVTLRRGTRMLLRKIG